MSEVLNFDPARRTSAQAILDLVTLGYLNADQSILDATYGKGRFWRKWSPKDLTTNDLDPARGAMFTDDYRNMRFVNCGFDVTVFDPPFKLNGTSAHPSDEAYGVTTYRSVETIAEDIDAGMRECTRVTRLGGLVIYKTQDQVSGGRKHWLSKMGFDWCGLRLVDELHITGYRRQPEGRPQKHARSNTSVLQVYQRTTRGAVEWT